MLDQYYETPPSDEIFEEVKEAAIKLWRTMGDEPSYAEGKVSRTKDLDNIRGNFMYIVAMFDSSNQRKLMWMVGDEAMIEIRKRRRTTIEFQQDYELIIDDLLSDEIKEASK